MTEHGELILQGGGKVAQLDDRDVAQLLAALEMDGAPVDDEALMAWLGGAPGALTLRHRGQLVEVEPIARDAVPERFGFRRLPAP
jgi:hypothetical protein